MVLEERAEERKIVEQLARKALRHPDLGRRTEILHIWHDTSFFDSRSWTVFESRDGGLAVRRVRWDQAADMARLTDPLVGMREGFHARPTLTVQDVPVSSDAVSVWLDELTRIRIQVRVRHWIQADGERHGIRLDSSNLELSWPSSGPEEWKDLTAWVGRVMDQLEAPFRGDP
ncbi:MAG TPA: hypothetical protein VJU16_04795 [Planctomycetota bacterium]|nr:hypothetical protein [Planctomycetota bacterium]